jgi:glycosyl transferase, family 25
MSIFLINLDRSHERLARFQTLASAAGFEFTRIAAVDGRMLSEQELSSFRNPDPKFYQLGPGEIGCFLSHRRAWEEIVASGLKWGTVFEDDVHIGADAANILRDFSWIPVDADIVKLETTLRPVTLSIESRAAPGNGRNLQRLWSRHGGTAGYVISRQCCVRLLADSQKPHDPLDQYMFNPVSSIFKHLHILQLSPALCVQDENYLGGSENSLKSTLHDERNLNKPKGLKKIMREIIRPVARFRERVRAGDLLLRRGRAREVVGFS